VFLLIDRYTAAIRSRIAPEKSCSKNSCEQVLKTTFKWIGIVLVGLLGLTAVLAVFLVTPPGESMLAGLVEREVSAALSRPVQIGKLRTNLIAHIALYDLQVSDQNGQEPLLTIDSVQLRYSLRSIVFGPTGIRSVVIDGLTAHIVRDRDGDLNVPAIAEDTSQIKRDDQESAGVTIDSLEVNGLAVTYRDLGPGLEAVISKGTVSATDIGGPLFAYTVEAEVIQVRLDLVPLPPLSLALQGHGDTSKITIDSLAMSADGLTVKATGSVETGSSAELKGEAWVTGDPNGVVAALGSYAGLKRIHVSADLNAHAVLSGTIDSPTVSIDLTLSRVESYGADVHDARLRLVWSGRELRIDTLTAVVFGGRINGSAHILPDSLQKSSANFHIDDLDVKRLMEATHDVASPYRGRISGDVNVQSIDTSLVGLAFLASLTATKLTYLEKSLPDLAAQIELENGKLALEISQDELAVWAAIDLSRDSAVGDFAAHVPDLATYGALLEMPRLGGKLDLNGRLSGGRNNPTVTATASGSNLMYQNVPIDTLAAEVTYSDSTLHVGNAFLETKQTQIDLLYPPLGIDSLAGAYGFRLRASGSLDDLSANGHINLREIQYRGYAADSVALFVTAFGQTISLDSARANLDSLSLFGAGSFNLADSSGVGLVDMFVRTESDSSKTDSLLVGHGEAAFSFDSGGAAEITLVGSDIAVAMVSALSGRTDSMTGTANVAAEFAGTVAAPSGRVRFVLVEPEYRGVSLDSIVAQAVLSPARLRLDTLKTFGTGQDLAMSATVQLGRDSIGGLTIPEDARVSGRAVADSVMLVFFEPLLPTAMTLSGRASMNIVWQGTVQHPNAQGSIHLRDVNFVPRSGADSITNFNLALVSEDTRFTIDTATGTYNGVPFTVAGMVDIKPWESLITDLTFTSDGLGRLRASGELSSDRLDLTLRIDTLALGLFEPFVPMIDTLDGTLSCDLKISGNPDNPEIIGNVLSRDLVVKPAALDSTIRNGLIKVSFNRTNATIDSIFVTLGTGNLFITGNLAYDDSRASSVDVTLTATRFYLSSHDNGWLQLDSARLGYSNTDDGFLLAGRINLGESRLTRDFDPELVLPWTREIEAAPSDWPSWIKKTALDIELLGNDQLWIDNNLAKARLRTSVAVIGTGARPNLSGQVTVEEGYLFYLDRKFEITQGSLMLSHPSRINPDIALTAETKVTNYEGISSITYTITFSVTGTMEKPEISLTSEPPLDQANIVSLLTLGVLRDQLVKSGDQNGPGAGAVLTARAARLTSERLAGIASRQVESALGLEEFTVQGNLFDPQENGGPQLLASKRLSDRVKITYLTTVGDANDQAIRVDYRLTTHMSLEGQTNRAGQAVLNIKFGLRFK
jgi:autotransporter translocation and assembly factor TamB